MTTEELELIEVSNQEAKVAIEKGEALKRLLDSADYKTVIGKGFLVEYPKELGLAIAGNTGAYDTDALMELLKGINSFVGYTFQVAANKDAAEQTLKDNAEYIANSDDSEDELTVEVL